MLSPDKRLRADFEEAILTAAVGVSAVDRLCLACVQLLRVDGAAISVVHGGASQGTFGASGDLSRRLDELQFLYGEGPCLDAVSSGRPVLVADVGDTSEQRWPAYSVAVTDLGVRGVFALPVAVEGTQIGALDLFCRAPGPLSNEGLSGGLMAAGLAVQPLLDELSELTDLPPGDREESGSSQALLERIEVYQATGMIMAQLDVGPAEALVRLRAHAFVTGQRINEVAWAVVERQLSMEKDDHWGSSGDPGSSS